MTSPRLAAAVRRLADQSTDRIGAATSVIGLAIGDVTTVVAGGASDGNALVKVTWRGAETQASGYVNTYTPTVGDRVVFAHVFDQVIVLGRIIGKP